MAPGACAGAVLAGLHMLMHTWWCLLLTSAALLVLALTPSSYRLPYREHVTLRLYTQTAPLLLGFALVTAVLAVVLTHIVVVTAHSYSLSHLALQVVIQGAGARTHTSNGGHCGRGALHHTRRF